MSSIPGGLPAISRQHAGSTAHSTLSPAYERRRLRIALGLEAHQDQLPDAWQLQRYLDSVLPQYPYVEKVSNSEYRNHRQRVIFDLRETTDKSVFRQWLETPELHVIYLGHARNGRGPCFGRVNSNHERSEDWGEGNNRTTSGLFRMGFPFLSIRVTEIPEHGYHAHLLKESEGLPPASRCHPQLRPYLSSLQPRTPDQLLAGLARFLHGHQPADRYWAYQSGDEWNVIHHAGWQNTRSQPSDWGATRVRCRVFCHFGCNSFTHNYPVVRRLAGWRRDGNDHYAFWTTNLSSEPTLALWVAHLITYDVENAFASWQPSLADAVTRTNRGLRAAGCSYQVI
jgi:hypothetical protein